MKKYRRKRHGLNTYEVLALFSFLLRAYLCYLTIDQIPIMKNTLYNSIFIEVFSLYTVLWGISHLSVSFFYQKGSDISYKGMALYFVIYIIYLLILFAILSTLTFLKILPI